MTESKSSDKCSKIYLQIKADSIYAHSLVIIHLSSDMPFSFQIKGEIISLVKGKIDGLDIRSIKEENTYVAYAEVLGLLNERPIFPGIVGGPQNSYGMRYYPFVSSCLNLEVHTFTAQIESVVIDLPDAYRIIWDEVEIEGVENSSSLLKHAYGPERSKYLISLNPSNHHKQILKILIPMRLGGARLLKLAHFPIYYWILSLLATSLAALQDDILILVAAIGAVWTFFLQQWSNSDLPQRNTLLTHLYLLSGASILAWGVFWKLLNLYAFVLLIPIFIIALIITRALRHFEKHGKLPIRLNKYWKKRINRML